MSRNLKTERFQISAINRTNNGLFSYSDGSPILKYNFSSTSKLLDTSSLRLCAKVRVKRSNNETPVNNDPVPASRINLQLSANNGAASLFSTVTLANGSGSTIESVRNYARMCASLLQQTNSWGDYSTNLTALHGCSANDKVQGRMCNFASGNGDPTVPAVGADGMYSFSICSPILLGFLSQGLHVNLSNDGGVGGLSLQLVLSPDSFSVFGQEAAAQRGTVELIDPILTGQYIIPDSIDDLPKEGTVVYSSWNSLYSNIIASDDTHSYSLGLGAVVSQVANNIPASQLNNYNSNSSLTPSFRRTATAAAAGSTVGNPEWTSPTATVTVQRSGIMYPLDFVIDSASLNPTQAGAAAANVYLNKIFDPQRWLYSMDAVTPYRQTKGHLANGETENVPNDYGLKGKYNYQNPQVYTYNSPTETQDFKINGQVFSIGCRYDMMNTRTGSVSFKDSQYSERLVTRLDGNTANALMTYFLHLASVDFSPMGVAVSV